MTDLVRMKAELIGGLRKFSPRAVALFGSYGMGFQDKYTHDVDIVVYTDRIPPPNDKKRLLSILADGSIPAISFPFDVDIFAREKEFCEVMFKSCRTIELCVSQLVDGRRDREEEVAIFVHFTKALFDDGWLNSQRTRIKNYPQKLLAANLSFFLFDALRQVHYHHRALKKRRQRYWAELCINEGLGSLMHAVFAANKTYYGKYKWAEVQCRAFKIKPKDFEQRLLHVMKSRDISAYERLALDVCSLCQKRYPNECGDVIALDSKLSDIDKYIESQKALSC